MSSQIQKYIKLHSFSSKSTFLFLFLKRIFKDGSALKTIYSIHNVHQCAGAISSELNLQRTFPKDNKTNAINRAFHLTNTSCLKTVFIYDTLLWTSALPG